jgi:hypothetical protein
VEYGLDKTALASLKPGFTTQLSGAVSSSSFGFQIVSE